MLDKKEADIISFPVFAAGVNACLIYEEFFEHAEHVGSTRTDGRVLSCEAVREREDSRSRVVSELAQHANRRALHPRVLARDQRWQRRNRMLFELA